MVHPTRAHSSTASAHPAHWSLRYVLTLRIQHLLLLGLTLLLAHGLVHGICRDVLGLGGHVGVLGLLLLLLLLLREVDALLGCYGDVAFDVAGEVEVLASRDLRNR